MNDDFEIQSLPTFAIMKDRVIINGPRDFVLAAMTYLMGNPPIDLVKARQFWNGFMGSWARSSNTFDSILDEPITHGFIYTYHDGALRIRNK